VLEESTEITVSISGDVVAGYWANLDNLLIYGKTNSASEDEGEDVSVPYQSSSITVKKVSGLSSDFIKGVDISSYISEVNSGVKFYNEEGTEVEGKSFIKTLADAGVNYIRLRVWNQPYVIDENTGEAKTDEAGNVQYYGGGNNDINTAVKICEYINAYNEENPDSTQIKVLVDLHYSDFWADPDKQTAPKAWKNIDIDTKEKNVKTFTQECIAKVAETGVTVGMVQIGNETNNGICGTEIPEVPNDESGNPIYTSAADSDYIKVFKAGCDAVKEYNEDHGTAIKRVVHFTDPHTAGTFYANLLDKCGVDYDVYATSYYPYWHGSTTNLTEMLSNIASECGVEVMVAETQYVYTNDDYDGADNQAYEGKDNIELTDWPVSVQGQANEIRDVIDAVASVGKSGIGMFYWEPAWLGVGNAYDEDGALDDTALTANKKLWNTYGSGWATDAAEEYDSSVKQWGGGGTNIENAALFDQNGKPLESLNVFKYVDYGATCSTTSYYSYKALDSVEVTMGSDANTIKESLPEKAVYYMNDDTQGEADIEWNEDSIAELVEKISKTSAIGKSYDISGNITVDNSKQRVKCTVRVEPANLLVNGGFEDEVAEEWALTNAWQDSTGSNQHNGNKFLKFENKTKDLQTVTASQTIEITEPGVYEAKTFVQGEYEAGSRDGEMIYLSASLGELYYESESVVLAAWQNWQVPVVSNIVITPKMIKKGLNKITVTAVATIESGVWGSFDDFYLYKAADVPADYVELDTLTVDKQTVSMKKGDVVKLSVSYNPSDTNEKGVVWASSNNDVITVDDGEIRAVGYGEAEITVSSQYDSDIKATCKVVVEEKENTSNTTDNDDNTPPAANDSDTTEAKPADKGATVQSAAGDKGTFKVTKTGTKPEVSYTAEKNASTVTIPATIKDANGIEYKVTSIVANSFKGNKKLKSVTIGANVTSIPANTFKGCTSLTSVKISASVKTIGANAFSGDTKLKKVTMGSSVKTIGDKAFYNCKKLTKITIPKTVTKIGKQAFAKCKALKTITIKSTKLTKSKVGSKAFKGINAKATIKVPKSKLKAYKTILRKKGVGSKAKIKKN
jgi:arabinogalactan endo-1,4-beta-galactosidase